MDDVLDWDAAATASASALALFANIAIRTINSAAFWRPLDCCVRLTIRCMVRWWVGGDGWL